MGIYPVCEADVSMAKPIRDIADVHTSFKQQGRMGMSQIVQSDLLESRSLHLALELRCDGIRIHGSPIWTAEDQVAIAIGLAP